MTGHVHLLRPLLAASLLAWLAACKDAEPTPPSAPDTYAVSGIVSETVDGVARPLAGQLVRVLIKQDRSRTMLSVFTDQNGRYTLQVPKSKVYVYAWAAHQPCLASATVTTDATIDVQVIPAGRFSTPPPTAKPLISGVVYEKTAAGRVPLRNAQLWLDASQDAYMAHTTTDEAGRFYLCRVDLPVRLDVFADGYQPYQHYELIPGTGDRFFEFEFTR